jgi:Protein of unknown function (DUF3298)
MQRRRLPRAAAVLAAVGVLAGWFGTHEAMAQSACAELGGTVDADQICHAHAANHTYLIDFAFPVDYPDQQALTDYLIQTRDGFINVSETPGSRNLPYVLDAKGTAYQAPGSESVVFEVFQNVGGAHPQTWYQTFNYNLAAGAPITFDTLFKSDANPLDVIFPIVQRELQRQTGVERAILPGDGLDPSNYQNFALTDDAVIFFFGQGELMPEVAGATHVAVPRAALQPVLA